MSRLLPRLLLAGWLVCAPLAATAQVDPGEESPPEAVPETPDSAASAEATGTQAPASSEGAPQPEPPKDSEVAPVAAPPPIYVPPGRGNLTQARAGAATRGLHPGLATLELLAPAPPAFTTREQPVLWWYLPAAIPARVDFLLVDPERSEPLVDTTLREAAEPGMHAVPLAEHGARLEKGRPYEWFVVLVPDPANRSRDVISGGVVQRVDAGPELRSALQSSPETQRWHVLAHYGVWYDALDGISQQIRQRPRDARLRGLRAQLLSEGGLAGASEHDRAAARAAR